ncbi:MAG: 6-phosphofructokinase [Bacillota bacterium]|nr:6-phosphofructokinase [Bacillota bacterium]
MKIAVLTSGGDAPGMNAAVRAVVRTAIHYGIEAYAVMNGYKGLVDGDIRKFERNDVGMILNRGGTILGSARLEEFKQLEVRQKAVDHLKALSIDALVTIGGDGTYRGAADLCDMGVNCMGIPGTIDNDIASTEYTIGFFTALNTALDCIDKLRDTSFSHQRCTVVELMGRHCGDLSIFAGVASGSEIVITEETGFHRQDVLDKIRKAKQMKKRHMIVVVAEHMLDVFALAQEIEDYTGYETRATVLGYVQRGGTPAAYDRILASKMGTYAVELVRDGAFGHAVCARGIEIFSMPLREALAVKRKRTDLYEYLEKIS